MVRLTLDVTPDLDARLDAWRRELGAASEGEVFRKALALLDVALEAKRERLRLGVAVGVGQPMLREIVGV